MNINDNIDPNEDLSPDAANHQDTTLPGIEEQEQLNASNLSQRIEEENTPHADYSDNNEIIEQPSQGEEDLSGFLERSIPDPENNHPIGSDRPLTKNLLGDNPPGAEQAAFDAGLSGDASAAQFQYNAENLVEGFRENLDKTENQIELDKKLREKHDDEAE